MADYFKYGRRGMSEEMMTLTGILTGLATIERQYREDRKDKEKFREGLILQDREMKWRSDEAYMDREARKLETSFRYIYDDKKQAQKNLAELDKFFITSGMELKEWESLDYINQTEDFKTYQSHLSKVKEEETMSALNDYSSSDETLRNLSDDITNLEVENKYTKFIMTKGSQITAEMGTTLPLLYEKYRDFSPYEGIQDEEKALIGAFTIDPAEEAMIFKELQTLRPDMFADLTEQTDKETGLVTEADKVMVSLVRRQIAPLVDPSIKRYSELASIIAADASLRASLNIPVFLVHSAHTVSNVSKS